METAVNGGRQVPVPEATLSTLQLGLGWLPEQPGGLDRVFFNLARHLPAVGVGVRGLVAAEEAGGPVEAFAPAGSPLARRLLAVRRATRRLLAASAVDVVAGHFALYTFPTLDLLRRPLVVHFHGPWADEAAAEGTGRLGVRLRRVMEQAVYGRADRFIVLSEAFRDVLVRSYGADAARVRVVPGGVEADRFDTGLSPRAARERLGWSTSRPIVLAVRRLQHRMGLEDLVEAAARVRAAVPDLLVHIAGAGSLAPTLDALIEARGLRQHVRLLGFVPDEDLPVAYRAADLSVVPTVALEGFGLIVAESLAAGTPALVTPVGGLPEVVEGLSAHLVLPAAGADALADGIARALSGRLPLPDADACRRFARARYDWPSVARQVRAVYEEVA
jgi:glycosyltransferase involved in cell wall biosynthesis